jgi:hypothetical protein
MNDVVRALGISAAILSPVVVAIVLISIAVVRRGEAGHGVGHGVEDLPHAKESVVAATFVKGAKAAPAGDEISVPHIFLYGLALFVLTIGVLLLLSLVQHLG